MDNSCETKESCIVKMKLKLKGSVYQIIGVVIGAIAGYVYYTKVGCISGTCAITSNPYMSILWGAIMGYLVSNIFKSKPKQVKSE
jgi:hypothetical protein